MVTALGTSILNTILWLLVNEITGTVLEKKYTERFKAERGIANAAIICSWKQVAFNMSIHLRREGEL